VFLREGYAGYVTPCRVLVVVLITFFLSSVSGLEFLLFDGDTGSLLKLQWGALGLYVLQGAGLLAPAE
jgi:predicted metal-dependent hydrolase